MPRLFHISEDENISQFTPRISKKQWNFEKYVWAINEKKWHNYLLPRECPRICIDTQQSNILSDYLKPQIIEHKKAMLFAPASWEEKIDHCTLFRYEFSDINFKLMDEIAGYYVSEQTEIPIHKTKIENCVEYLNKLNIALIMVDNKRMLEIKEKVVQHLKAFSIIRWKNFNS